MTNPDSPVHQSSSVEQSSAGGGQEPERLAIFRDTGWGSRLAQAADAYASEYIFSPDEAADHEPTEFERMLMLDMLAGLFADEKFNALLQEAARGMKAADMDPEGEDLPAHATGARP